jgi:diguanylate cyclase (GGDEF)-like protein
MCAAATAAVSIILITALVFPHSATPLAPLRPFLTMFSTAVFLFESLTAYFLAIQFFASRDASLAALAGAYGFTAVLVLCQILVFPGIFSASGLFDAGPQTAIWIWVFWHSGFPILATSSLALRARHLAPARAMPRIGTALLLAGPLLALAAAYIATAWSSLLPPLVAGNSYLALQHSPIATVVLGLAIIPFLLCVVVTRLSDLLSLWLGVALLAGIADIVLSISASARFSLGWYVGRGISLVASCIVLFVLILEFSKLYHQLIKSHAILAQRAIHDGLTGAFNRSYFIEQLPREMRRAIREREPISLLMVDVDHFKLYNDSHGHQMGDDCLIAVVGAMQSSLRRPADFVARYGGEEFVVVLPNTPAEGAALMAETMRLAVRGLGISRDQTTGASVTISIGIASFDACEDEFDVVEFIRRADHAMYQAKARGRDSACAYMVSGNVEALRGAAAG